MSPSRRAFTLAEAVIGAALLALIAGGLLSLNTSARKGVQVAGLHLDLLEGATLAIHQIRLDLRQLAIFPQHPVPGYSVSIASDNRSLRMRRTARMPGGAAWFGSSFVNVEYALVPLEGTKGRFHLVRREWTASGAPIPGQSVSRREKRFRSFMLEDCYFAYQKNSGNDDGALQVHALVVTGEGERTAGHIRTFLVSNVLEVLRPDEGWEDPAFVPRELEPDCEHPPGDVLAPRALDAEELEAPQ